MSEKKKLYTKWYNQLGLGTIVITILFQMFDDRIRILRGSRRRMAPFWRIRPAGGDIFKSLPQGRNRNSLEVVAKSSHNLISRI